MNTKKNARVSLEKKRNMFFLMGLTIALGTTLMAFEWKSNETNTIILEPGWGEFDLAELPPITRPPEPPKPKIKQKVTVFEILDPKEDDIEIDEIDFASLEFTSDPIPDVPAIIDTDEDVPVEFWVVETKPEFIGGMAAFYKFVSNKIVYPKDAVENGVEGVVYISFTIDKDGKIIDAKPVRDGDLNLDREATRIFNIMPKWKPGKQRGKPVKVSYVLPIKFVLG